MQETISGAELLMIGTGLDSEISEKVIENN